MAKKKKKKQQRGARRPTYAKGKPVESSGKKTATATPAKKAAAAPAAKPSTKGAGGRTTPERIQWNLIRKGTLEQKVFMTLLYIIIVATLLSYPLRLAEAQRNYDEAKKDLKKWEQKYPTKAEQKKQEKEKPVLPPKPTFGIMLLELFMGAVQGVLFAFLGLNISRRTDLETPLLDGLHSGGGGADPGEIRDLLAYAVPTAVILLIPLVGKDVIVDRFFPAPKGGRIKYSAWKYSLSSMNDSVQFQMLFVLLVFSAFVWLFFRYREQVKFEPHCAGMAASFLFAMGFIYLNMFGGAGVAGEHVSGAEMLAFASVFSLPVLILGYLYWKKGLEYSLLAGVIGFGIYPFLATLIIK